MNVIETAKIIAARIRRVFPAVRIGVVPFVLVVR